MAEVVNLAEKRRAKASEASEGTTTPENTAEGSTEASTGSGQGGETVQTSSHTLTAIIGTAAGLGLAGYLAAVTLQGNLPALWKQLQKEELYLEFAIAIVAVWALMKYGPTSPIVDLIVIAAVAAVALKVAGGISLQPALSNFASGKASIAQTIQAITSGTGTQITV